MGTIGDLLGTSAEEKVNKEMAKCILRKRSTGACATTSPTEEELNLKASQKEEAKNFIKSKILKEKAYGEILRGGREAVVNG